MPAQQRNFKKCANCTVIGTKYTKFPPPCGHVICNDCFPNDSVQRANTLDPSKCPVCQQILLFPNEKPKSCFRTLRQFGYVRDCLLVKDPPECRSCSDGQTKATAQCENCLEYLCSACADPHIAKATLFDKHYVYTFEDIREGRSKWSARCETTCCCDEGSPISKFCESCEATFCEDCAEEHQHCVVDLQQGLNACIESYTEKMEACSVEASVIQQKIKTEWESLSAQYQTREKKIRDHADLLISKIEQERDEAVAHLNEELEVHMYHKKPLDENFAMSEAQVVAIKTSIALINSIVEQERAGDSHLTNVFTFLKANTKAIDDIGGSIRKLNEMAVIPTPYAVIINHDVQVRVQRAQIFHTLNEETLQSILDGDTRIDGDHFQPHVVSTDTYTYPDGNCCIFVADEENRKVKVFIIKEEEDGSLILRLHKPDIGGEKEPAVVFQDGVRDNRDQLKEAICIHYNEDSDPGSYHLLDGMLHQFDQLKPLQKSLKVKSVGPRCLLEVTWNKSANLLNINEPVAREGFQQGYFLLELVNTLRIELRFSRCVEGVLFVISGYHRPSKRSILLIGCRERPLRVLRFDHDTPGGVAIDSKCNIYYADPCNNRVLVLTKSSEIIHIFVGICNPIDLCVLKKNEGPAEEEIQSLQSEDDLLVERKELLVVILRKGGLKIYDLRQVWGREQYP